MQSADLFYQLSCDQSCAKSYLDLKKYISPSFLYNSCTYLYVLRILLDTSILLNKVYLILAIFVRECALSRPLKYNLEQKYIYLKPGPIFHSYCF